MTPQPRFESAHGKNEITITAWPDIIYLTHRNYGQGTSGFSSTEWQMSFDDTEALGRNLLAAAAAGKTLKAEKDAETALADAPDAT